MLKNRTKQKRNKTKMKQNKTKPEVVGFLMMRIGGSTAFSSR